MPTQEVPFFWLLLNRIPGVGPRRFLRLLELADDPEAVFALGPEYWRRAGLAEASVEVMGAVARQPRHHELGRLALADMAWLERQRASVLTLFDDAYPPLLRELSAPPPLLHVLGRAEILHKPQLAIVGARTCSQGGLDTAYDFARGLVAEGLVITSGLALGIDAAAHQGALDAGGETVAVLGTGLDCLYPQRNRKLAAAIIESGTIISELPLGTTVRKENFPRRNRVISGLASGVLVVEAAPQSGSLITARYALEQNREVFAIPGSIHNPLARGCHALIKDGAKLVETVADIGEELQFWPSRTLMPRPLSVISPARLAPSVLLPTLEPAQQHLLALIGDEPMAVDSLIERSQREAGLVAAELVQLELLGVIEQVAGGYQRCHGQ